MCNPIYNDGTPTKHQNILVFKASFFNKGYYFFTFPTLPSLRVSFSMSSQLA